MPDAENLTNGKQFTLNEVRNALTAAAGDRLGDLMIRLESHIGDDRAQDDISIVEITPPIAEQAGVHPPALAHGA